MATIRYKLRTDKAGPDGTAPIHLLFQNRGDRFSYATGERLSPQHWDEPNERARRSYTHATQLNGYLTRLRNELERLVVEAKAQGQQLDASTLKDALTALERPNAAPSKSVLLLAVLENFITASIPHRQSNTIKTYRTLSNHLTGFVGNRRVKLGDFDTAMASQFTAYLAEQGLVGTSVAKALSVLKRMFNWASDEMGLPVPANFRLIKSTRPKATIAKIALTEAELNALAALNLDNRKALLHARDTFLFACYTGLRYSDIEKLKPENVQDGTLSLTVVKTRERYHRPLLPQAAAILERYKGRYPKNALPVVSNQKLNAHLKELGQLAGLETPVQLVRFVGNRREEETVPKWALLTTHSARRTFATLSLERGMQPAILQRLLGHADIRQTMQYAKLTEQAVENELHRVWSK